MDSTWRHLLAEASCRAKVSEVCIYLFGSKESGKGRLLSQWKKEDIRPSIIMQYTGWNMMDNELDDLIARLACWRITKTDTNLVSTILKTTHDIKQSVFGLVVDLSTPWTIAEDLNEWIQMITEAVQPVMNDMKTEERKACLDYQRTKYLEYKSPLVSSRNVQLVPQEVSTK